MNTLQGLCVIYDDRQARHQPKTRLTLGRLAPNLEIPERARLLLEAVRAAGADVREPADHGEYLIRAVHEAGYLDFLRFGFEQWAALQGAGPEMRPSLHPNEYMARVPQHILARAGHYLADAGCVVLEGTWDAAYASAQSAIEAVEQVRLGHRLAYALCRPPGHHAYGDKAGGFCYLNNVAIAATAARRHAPRVAILDLDVHHGNGTQQIFYDRDDVFFASIHGDPAETYPFYAGYPEERGTGEGEGFTLNLPLPHGRGDDAFLAALDIALREIAAFDPAMLLLSLGQDASGDDPLGCLRVTAAGFEEAGRRAGALGRPTAAIQEGGYVSPTLGDNLVAFLRGVRQTLET